VSPTPEEARVTSTTGTTEEPVASRRDVRTVIVSSLVGTTVEWYDFFLYSTAAGLVFNKLFFPVADPATGSLLAFATFAVGFVARPLGGILFGHIGDRVGRKRTLVATMIIMGLSTFCIGLLPTYDQVGLLAPALLVALRVLQGIAIGGEWGGAVLMAVEYAPPNRRGLYGSWPQVGLAIGLALGTGLFGILGAVLDDANFAAYGWRIGFFASIALVAVGLVVRLKVYETPAFRRLRDLEGRARMPFMEMLRDRRGRRNTGLGLLSRWAEGVAFNAWAVFSISYTTETLHLAKSTILVAVTAAAVLLGVALPFSGHLADRFGARRVFATGSIVLAVLVVPAFAGLGTGRTWLVALVLLVGLGLAYPLMYGPQAILYASLFPTRVRYTGMSFVYQFSGVYASGLTPLILTALLAGAHGSPWTACAYVVVAAVVSAVATLAIRRRDLFLT
jgi:MFS family permease